MHKLLICCFALMATLQSLAQLTKKEKRDERKQRINVLTRQEEEGVITYHKQYAIGFKLTSDGYGGFFELGRSQSIKKALLFQLDISERKHPKENKQTNFNAPISPFIYGKINYFYPIKTGVQQQFLFGNKTNKNGVTVSGNFGGGISLALLRPNFLLVNDLKNGNRKIIRYESNDSTFISAIGQPNYVPDSTLFTESNLLNFLLVSGAGLSKGWGQIKVIPGLYAKASLRFDYGKYNKLLSALEAGVTGELYSKKIPQLVYAPLSQFFVGAFVGIMIGKRK